MSKLLFKSNSTFKSNLVAFSVIFIADLSINIFRYLDDIKLYYFKSIIFSIDLNHKLWFIPFMLWFFILIGFFFSTKIMVFEDKIVIKKPLNPFFKTSQLYFVDIENKAYQP